MDASVDLAALATRIESCFPPLSVRGRPVAVAAHRALARGTPVPDLTIATATGLQICEVREEMEGWPSVHRDEAGRIVGFWGLGLGGTPHRFIVGGRVRYTWCAWDSLFLPEILGSEATVESECAATGADIHLVLGPDATVDPRGSDVAISFVDPEVADVDGDRVISTFCHRILFFSSTAAAEEWPWNRDDGIVLGLADALELGRLCNGLRYGDSLTTASPPAGPRSPPSTPR